jgi:hypothetical protein
MIVTELYNGQGLGNQLWCYFVTRIIAEKKGYEFGIMSTHKFKAKEFMVIDFGNEVTGGSGPEGGPPGTLPNGIDSYYREKFKTHALSNLDISRLDENMIDIEDNTKIDGIMQSCEYLRGYRDKILSWISLDEEKKITGYSSDNCCIIHIRGGDFKYSKAILDESYYKNSMRAIKEKKGIDKFYCVTDDISYARSILPDVELIGSSISGEIDSNKGDHHIGGPIWMDYSILNSAKNVIMSASSFGWWPVWTNKNNPFVIAPKYWAAYKINSGYWSCAESLVEEWNYIDLDGSFFTGNECKKNIRYE